MCYNDVMKILRIDDELHKKIKYLAEKDRRTINSMAEILLETGMGKPFIGDSPKVIEDVPYMRPGGTPPSTKVDDLVKKSEATPLPDAQDILQSNLEQVCCGNETRPCKHWVWDAQTGEGYKNLLSGRVMEVE